jgi:alanine racemase
MRATKARISIELLRHNIQAVRERIGPHPLICFAVKADGYGHGAIPISRAALDAGVQYLGVATVSEGVELREAGITAPILLFSIAAASELPALVAADISPFVTDRDYATSLSAAAAASGVQLRVHLKIDTGMHRIGCTPESAPDIAAFINTQPSLIYAGTATHLAVADSTSESDIQYTKLQLSRFRAAVDAIRAAGLDPGIVHAANSGAIALHEESYFDMVRPGIILYGYPPAVPPDWPSAGAIMINNAIRPILELVTEIVFIKTVSKGGAVSYGRTWTAPEDQIIGTIPIGYADGLVRAYAGKLSVYVRGRACPIVGRICMDQCMVGLGAEGDVQRGDEVTVIGGCAPDAAAVGALVGTIPYEVTCGINKRVPRVYINL